MKIFKFIALAGLTAALSASANAQFSAAGGGSAVPASGTGGGGAWPLGLPPTPAVSTANVGVAVFTIDSVVIDGYSHTWIGDTMATLSDPLGVEHLLYVRPGSINGSFGNSGDFTGGSYTFVETGGVALPISGDALPGTYNQGFDTGAGTPWNSGDAGIINTPMTTISGPSGNWTLTIYDWAGGDSGNFSGWTLNGNGGGGGNVGSAYCFGDGSGASCPCSAFGAPGSGCANTGGMGATLTGAGNAAFAGDSFSLDIVGVPGAKPGLVLKGDNAVAIPAGDGILCTSGASLRSHVQVTDGSGATSFTDFNGGPFGAVANAGGVATNFQFWYRDPSNTCSGGGFNFTNAWTVTYLP